MRRHEIYEGIITGIGCILIGIEMTLSSLWYIKSIHENPVDAFKESLVITIPIVVALTVLFWMNRHEARRRLQETVATQPRYQSFADYLKVNKKLWLFIGALLLVLPLVTAV